MARITNTNIVVNFALGAGSTPTTTQTTALITAYYKKSYRYCYGLGNYSADESTDTKGIIDTDEYRQELADLLSHKIQRWHEAGKNSDGSINPMPKFDLFYDSDVDEERRQFLDFLDDALTVDNENIEYIDNCRLYGSDFSDYSGVFY